MAGKKNISKEGFDKGAGSIAVLPLRDAVHFPTVIHTIHVARERSIRALQYALRKDKRVLVLSQRDMDQNEPGEKELHHLGTISEVLQAMPFPDGSFRAVLRGLKRGVAEEFSELGGVLMARLTEVVEPAVVLDAAGDALRLEAKEAFSRISTRSASIPPEAAEAVLRIQECGFLADTMAHYLQIGLSEKQTTLEIVDAVERLNAVYLHVRREERILECREKVRSSADARIVESQKEFILREHLRAIHQELHGNESPTLSRLKNLSESALLPPTVQVYVEDQLQRLEFALDDSPESGVVIKHLEVLLALPWNRSAPTDLDLNQVSLRLDATHLYVDESKCRVLEFLAVRKLTGGKNSPILCFEGPPGVGKTSLARSIAEVLGRPFISLSLGGLRDEAELRGHRRTYVGAHPGRIMQGLLTAGHKNPIFLLDELDKIAFEGQRSDAAAALLEILDPQLNKGFVDHFVDFPFDLSDVLFIATANSTEGLPAALKDRLEIIPFYSYSEAQRFSIATEQLIPTVILEHGLTQEQLVIEDQAVREIIRRYTNDSGLRQLQRAIATLCRKAAMGLYRNAGEQVAVTADSLEDLLGLPEPRSSSKRMDAVGTSWGLVVATYGGDALQIETAFIEPYSSVPVIRLTGNMGPIMQESAETAVSFLRSGALSWLRSHQFKMDVHVHTSQADKLKEGPSAGLAITLAIASSILQQPLSSDLAITGEITLLGKVLPVGGVREKLIAAHRLGFTRVILPLDNCGNIGRLPEDVRTGLVLLPVSNAEEALREALSPATAAVMA